MEVASSGRVVSEATFKPIFGALPPAPPITGCHSGPAKSHPAPEDTQSEQPLPELSPEQKLAKAYQGADKWGSLAAHPDNSPDLAAWFLAKQKSALAEAQLREKAAQYQAKSEPQPSPKLRGSSDGRLAQAEVKPTEKAATPKEDTALKMVGGDQPRWPFLESLRRNPVLAITTALVRFAVGFAIFAAIVGTLVWIIGKVLLFLGVDLGGLDDQ